MRRILTVCFFVSFLLGTTAVDASAAQYEVCPWIKLGPRHYVVCVPIP